MRYGAILVLVISIFVLGMLASTLAQESRAESEPPTTTASPAEPDTPAKRTPEPSSLSAQGRKSHVKTPGGTNNSVPIFTGSSTIANSALREDGRTLTASGVPTTQLRVVGSLTTARFGQDALGGFAASDTSGASFRLLTNSSGLLTEWMRLTSYGKLAVTSSVDTNGEFAVAQDNLDDVHSYIQDAGSQMHLRLSRGACDQQNPTSPNCDFGNFDARDFLITPYMYGMAIEYPSNIEVWSHSFSVHQNHRGCSGDVDCNAAASFWVGDQTDTGGLYVSAFDGTPTGQPSHAVIAVDKFAHSGHGSLKFVVRDPTDSFVFQTGAYEAEHNVARIDATGKGFFDGGTQTGGADFAEAVEVSGEVGAYEPGDVLAIDETSDRRITLAREAYSTRVAGIYSTKPGVLAMPHGSEDARGTTEVPLAVIGIVPCKASAENGPIRPGDLLVTSSRPGHAMKGTDPSKMNGAVVGKALQGLGSGTGVIQVLVALQ